MQLIRAKIILGIFIRQSHINKVCESVSDDGEFNGDDCEDNDLIEWQLNSMEITKLPNMSTLELTLRIPSMLTNLVKTKDFHKLLGNR